MATLTQELFTLPLDDSSYLIYAPLQRSALIGNRQVLRFLASVSRGVEPDPSEPLTGLLRELGILDPIQETIPSGSKTGDPEPTTVTLFLTTACNLRCTYCYASAGDMPAEFMSLEVAQQGIDFVVKNALRLGTGYFTVCYHGGGEPSVNWKTLTDSFAYASRRATDTGLQLHTSLATNGVLTDPQIDWIVQNIRGATVSFDGLPELQDKNRPNILGQGVSQRVLHTLRRFDEANFRYGIRATVLSDQVSRLPDAVDFVLSRFRPGAFQVEPVYPIGRGRGGARTETDEFIHAFREARRRAANYNRDLTFSAVKVGVTSNHFCAATLESFCLSADGGVTACYEVFSEKAKFADKFFYGRPSDRDGEYEFDQNVLSALRASDVHGRAHCRDCFAKYTCAGDCYHKTLEAGGGAEFSGSPRCHVIRELTKDLILEQVAQSGGAYWRQA